jgi:hypothetical protein
MKIRVGFVSNSSSSSYILALPKEKECEHCGHNNAQTLKIARELFAKKNKDWKSRVPDPYSGDPKHYIDSINIEIEEIDKDIKWSLKKIKLLENLRENDDAIILFNEWNTIERKTDIRPQRLLSEYKEEENIDTKEKLKRDIEYLNWNIRKKKERKTKLKSKRHKIERAVKDDDTLYVFEVDHRDNGQDIIEMLIDNGTVKIIEKIVG